MTTEPDELRDFAGRYTEAWCSGDPTRVAEHYAADGSLTINAGTPSVGRTAITEAARSFMDAFPDMRVLMVDVRRTDTGSEYHWTLVGTNTGPGGTGNRVRISGYEEWTLGDDGLIADSQGHYDQAEYDRQIEQGSESSTPETEEAVMPVMSFVSATIAAERRDDVTRPYSDMVAKDLPDAIRQTFLLVGDDGTMAIATVWNSREELDAMRASGEEPFARRVLREAGGEPQAVFFDIAAEAPQRGR